MGDLYYSGGASTKKMCDLPMSCFENTFIESCSDLKQLEKILKVLRSGSEGSFSHLEQAAERRIQDLDPNNRLLRRDAQIHSATDLSPEKRQDLHNDLNLFLNDIKMLDDDLKRTDGACNKGQQPPVRPIVKIVKKQDDVKKSSERRRDYKEWDKINFDALEKEMCEEKLANISNEHTETEEGEVLTSNALSQRELLRTADMNKVKGNEYFTAGDYEKAIIHYSRSISVVPSAASYNNRALAYLKQGNHSHVIRDCQHVLNVEPDNVKALLRRGSAYQALSEYGKAKLDFQLVLELEPQNLRARKLLKETMNAWKTVGKKLLIAEVDGSDDDITDVVPSHAQESNKPVNDVLGRDKDEPSTKAESAAKSRRLVIAETDESEEETIPTSSGLGNETDSYSAAYDQDESVSSSASARTASTDLSSDSEQMNSSQSIATTMSDSPLPINTTDVDSNLRRDLARLSVDNGGIPESTAVQEPSRMRFIQSELSEDLLSMKESGNEAFRAGQYGSASDIYSRIITKINACVESKLHHIVNLSILYNNRAMCQIKLGDCKAAIEDCNQSLALIPHSIKPLLRRAQAYETLEKYKEGYRDFQHAFCLQAGQDLAQQGLGRCGHMLRAFYGNTWRSEVEHVSVNQLEVPLIITQSEVDTELTELKDSNKFPMSPSQADAPVATLSLITSNRTAETDSAPSCLDDEIEYDRLKALGNECVGKCEYHMAIDLYTRCLQLYKDKSAVYANRALCYLRLHRTNDVISDCNEAIQLDQGNVKAWFRRALAKKNQKDYRGSMEDFLQVLRLDGGNTSAKRELDSVKAAYKDSFAKEKRAAAETRAKVLIKVLDEENGDLKAKIAKSSRVDSTENDHQSTTTSQKGCRSASKKCPVGPYPTVASPKLTKVSPFEFIQAWHSLKGSNDTTPYAQLLNQIEPSQLRLLLGNKLDSEMLTTILRTIHESTLSKSVSRAYQMLHHLRHVERFDMASMFMTTADKLIVRETLEKISRDSKNLCTKTDLTSLRKAYKV